MAESVRKRGMVSPGQGQSMGGVQVMSRQASLQRIHIDDLPAEILGKVVSHLEDKERSSLVPLVSKYWLHVHKKCPPHRKEWVIYVTWPVTLPMVRWFVSIASNLEVLSVESANPEMPCYLPQMLALAASSAPKLRELTIGRLGVAQPIMHSLALLTQLTELTLSQLEFPANGDVSGIACISALRSLKAINFQRIYLPNATTPLDGGPDNQADERWRALSHLKHLTQLNLIDWEFKEDNEEEYNDENLGGWGAPFFWNLSLVTQLRSLLLLVMRECLVERLYYPDAFSKLTQLTAFESSEQHPSSAGFPVLGLPQLERLTVGISQIVHEPGDFVVQSKHLTYMSIDGFGGHLLVQHVLPPCTPALSTLRVLKLVDCGLEDFPASVARGMRQLCELNLRCNSLESVPSAVRDIAKLTKLDLSENKALQLDRKDLAILEALSDLRLLKLKKGGELEDAWSFTSLHVIDCIRQVCCDLEVEV